MTGVQTCALPICVVGHVSINESQAVALINAGLHFAAGDEVTLQAAAGTHLGTSLKELQKLGVDAVTVAGGAGELSLSLGDEGTLSASGLPVFDAALDVTLDVGTAAQLHELGVVAGQTAAGHTLGEAGLDAVELQLGGQKQLDALLSSTTLKDDLAALRADGVSVTTIDVGGHAVVGHVSINESQAVALIDAGLHFAAGDDVTLQAAGTHLGTSLKELQKLGVDAVVAAGGGVVGEIVTTQAGARRVSWCYVTDPEGTNFTFSASPNMAAAIALHRSTSRPVHLPWLSEKENPARPVLTAHCTKPLAFTASKVWPASAGNAETQKKAAAAAASRLNDI